MNYLWPYHSVELKFKGKKMTLSSPWIKLEQTIGIDENHEYCTKVIDVLTDSPKSIEDIQLVHQIFEPLQKFPLFFSLPSQTKLMDLELSEASTDYTSQCRWDAQAVLEFSETANGGTDPVSALSYLKLFHLEDMKKSGQESSVPSVLEMAKEKNQLKPALEHFVRQNHYVTEKCEEVLRPAVSIHSVAGKAVEQFIKEEAGHDKLLRRSIKSLDKEPENLVVLGPLVKLMDHFKFVAGKNLLAFCFIVDMFERENPDGVNPVSTYLDSIGEHKASGPIKTHSDINVEGGHENESYSILEKVGLLHKSYVIEAVYLSQYASDLMQEFADERRIYCENLSANEV